MSTPKTTPNAARDAGQSIVAALNSMISGDYGDGKRASFLRQGGPLAHRTLCRAAKLGERDFATDNATLGFYFSR